MNWDWIWQHYAELTPQEKRIVSETVNAEMRRAFGAFGAASLRATGALQEFGRAYRAAAQREAQK